MTNIIDLQETSPDHWRAKYEGNYGVYTIKITTDGKERKSFSCSCPSDAYPCKHIAMIEKAIAERMTQNTASRDIQGGKGSAEELLKSLTREELYNFIVRLIKYNADLSNAVLLEFSYKLENKNKNKYSSVIREGLEAVNFDRGDDDYYYDETEVDIDILDQWFERAEQYLAQKKAGEAVLIAQACIEEFAEWLEQIDFDSEYISDNYQSLPFEILESAVNEPGVNAKDLYDYCMSEMSKGKYADLAMLDEYNRLLMKVSAEIDPDAFIALQYTLLNEIENRSSYKAKKILQRVIDFYTICRQPDKARKCIEENIQIESFRKIVVESNIEKNNLAEAKELIHEFVDAANADNRSYSTDWDNYILQIARKEEDIPTIREFSYSLLKKDLKEEYYRIYKSTFSGSEWAEEFENLLDEFEGKSAYHVHDASDILVMEGNMERLMAYIERNLSVRNLESYYQHFASAFPEKTLALFREAINVYAEKNVGRSHYEHIAALFDKMAYIEGGAAVVANMKDYYRLRYKNRRAMIETLNYK
jgi:hypothetical protein